MTLSSLAFSAGVLSSLLYAVLSLFAAPHRQEEEGSRWLRKPHIINGVWAFEHEQYDTEGQRLCRYGRIVFLCGLAGYVT